MLAKDGHHPPNAWSEQGEGLDNPVSLADAARSAEKQPAVVDPTFLALDPFFRPLQDRLPEIKSISRRFRPYHQHGSHER